MLKVRWRARAVSQYSRVVEGWEQWCGGFCICGTLTVLFLSFFCFLGGIGGGPFFFVFLEAFFWGGGKGLFVGWVAVRGGQGGWGAREDVRSQGEGEGA